MVTKLSINGLSAGKPLQRAKINQLAIGQMSCKERAFSADSGCDAAIRKEASQPATKLVSHPVQPLVCFRSHLLHRLQSRCHGNRIGIERPTMMNFPIARMVEYRHHSGRAGYASHREAAADDFCESRQVG